MVSFDYCCVTSFTKKSVGIDKSLKQVMHIMLNLGGIFWEIDKTFLQFSWGIEYLDF